MAFSSERLSQGKQIPLTVARFGTACAGRFGKKWKMDYEGVPRHSYSTHHFIMGNSKMTPTDPNKSCSGGGRILCWMGLFFLLAVIASTWVAGGGENLYGCKFILSADQPTYRVGEEIRLTLTITSPRRKVVHFYKNMENTVYISPLEDSQYRKDTYEQQNQVSRVELAPGVPFNIFITGYVEAANKRDMVLVNFREYGKTWVKVHSRVGFCARAYPVRTRLDDSVDWPFSNEIYLVFEK